MSARGERRYSNKIAMPRLAQVLDRPRLFRVLDKARSRKILWVSGPAGCGKTTLVASYVRRRKVRAHWYRVDASDADVASVFHHLRTAAIADRGARARRLPVFTAGQFVDLRSFARRFFEELFQSMPRGSALVLDDYQHVAESELWNQIVHQAISSVPDGIRMIVTSREPPPAAFVRHALERALTVIGASDLSLSVEEAVALARLRRPRAHGGPGPSRGAVEELHSAAAGWVAGFVLVLERAFAGGVDPKAVPEQSALFDYMAAEILATMDRQTERLLVRTSILPVVTEGLAVSLTRVADAGKILSRLHRYGLFVEEERADKRSASYRYHPLFRSFLLHRAENTLARAKLAKLRADAAALLVKAGRIEDALELFREAEEYSSIEAVILDQAMRFLEEGRVHTLGRWLAVLPEDRLTRNGWLLYWRGVAGFYSAEPRKLRDFEEAHAQFERRGDAVGMALAATSCIGANVAEGTNYRALDRWMVALGGLSAVYEHAPPPVKLQMAMGMVSAMTFRGPAHGVERDFWVSRALALARAVESPSQRRMALGQILLFHAFRGEVALGKGVLALLEDAPSRAAEPMTTVVVAFAATLLHWMAADHELGLGVAERALAGDDGSTVRLWGGGLMVFGGMCAVDLGDQESARRYLDLLARGARAGRPLDVGSHLFFASYVAFLRGDLEQSRRSIVAAISQSELRDSPFLRATNLVFEAGVHFERGDSALARARLRDAEEFETEIDHPILTFWRLVMEASIDLDEGKRVDTLQKLEKLLPLGRALGVFGTMCPKLPALSRLCEVALVAKIEPDYVRELIRRRGLVASAAGAQLADWPWAVRVRAFGDFEVEVEGEPLRTFGKSTMPPLLLQAIVALGGRGRGVTVEKLVSVLWPDADGDRGMHAFEVTLARLRKALGAAGGRAICLRGGRVSLDSSLCWTDVAALDALCAELGVAGSGGHHAVADRGAEAWDLVERLFALYRGPLCGERDLPPALLSARERIQAKIAAAIRTLTRRLRVSDRPSLEQALRARAEDVDECLGALIPPLGLEPAIVDERARHATNA